MDKRIETAWLLDFYGPLLTPRQQEVLRLYCEEDLSLAEIAAQEEISRQGVHDTVNKACAQLEHYEQQLGLLSRYRRITLGLEECRLRLAKLRVMPQSASALAKVRTIINELIEDEEGEHGV